MSRIDELIEELCPQGVLEIQLGEVVEVIGGHSFPASGFNVVGDGLRVIRIGDINVDRSRVYWSGKFPEFAKVEDGDLLMSLSGDINVLTWKSGLSLLNQRVAKLLARSDYINSRYLYYYLKFRLKDLSQSTSKSVVANLSLSDLRSFLVPLPPLPIQKEIVSILDKFTQLEAELEAELEARRTQYEVTRDRLLDFSGDPSAHPMGEKIRELCPEGVPSLPLLEVCERILVPMRDRPKDLSGDIPWCRIEDIDGHRLVGSKIGLGVSMSAVKELNLKVFPTGTVVASCSASLGTYAIAERPLITNQTFIGLVCGSRMINKFLLYLLTTMTGAIRQLASTGTIPYVSREKFERLIVPVPPLEVQLAIVLILDKLDALVNDISYGLPAEIAARRKQYEYYRNKLLTFKEMDAA